MSTFTAYMEELIDNGYGGTDKRKHVWSIPRAKQAEQVWNDCLQQNGVRRMEPQIENAVRSVARKCREAIITATKDKPRAEHDPIITEILNFHAKQIQCLPPNTFTPKLWLTYYVRLVDKESRNDAG